MDKANITAIKQGSVTSIADIKSMTAGFFSCDAAHK